MISPLRATRKGLPRLFWALAIVSLWTSAAEATEPNAQADEEVVISRLLKARLHGAGAAEREKAARQFAEVQRLHPNSPHADDALYHAGLGFMSAKRYKEAIKAFAEVLERYPGGVLVSNGAWFRLLHEIRLGRKIRSPALYADAMKAVGLYEKYLQAYPIRTADWARYRMAVTYAVFLGNKAKAKSVIEDVPQAAERRSALLRLQDEAFTARLDSTILKDLRDRYSPGLHLRLPPRTLGGSTRKLRVRLGMPVSKQRDIGDEKELRHKAAGNVKAFFEKNLPAFEMPKIIRSEELAAKRRAEQQEKARADLQKSYEKALRALNGPAGSPVARNRAVVTLGRSGRKDAVPFIIAELERQLTLPGQEISGVVVHSAMRALGRLRDPRAVPRLVKFLDEESVGVPKALLDKDTRLAAIAALAEIGDSSAVPHLRKCLESKDATVRELAARVIGAIQAKKGKNRGASQP